MDRRKLLSWFGLGSLLSGFPGFLASCTNNQTPVAGTTSTVPKTFRAIGTVAQLQKDGQLKTENVLVIANSSNLTLPIAVNPTCTHKGCTVDWKSDRQEFVCPCHKAAYGTDGSVKQPPATKPLATYAVKIENNQVLISG